MSDAIDHIAGQTFHGRKGDVENAFRYSVDYLLVDAEADVRGPTLFRRNGKGAFSLNDLDHGGAPKNGSGARWVRDVLTAHQITGVAKIELLAQPKVLGHVFNPVSFWLCRRVDGALITVIAEVTNTFGDRHSYLVHHPDLRPIERTDRLNAQKIFHVSPFQPVEGQCATAWSGACARCSVMTAALLGPRGSDLPKLAKYAKQRCAILRAKRWFGIEKRMLRDICIGTRLGGCCARKGSG